MVIVRFMGRSHPGQGVLESVDSGLTHNGNSRIRWAIADVAVRHRIAQRSGPRNAAPPIRHRGGRESLPHSISRRVLGPGTVAFTTPRPVVDNGPSIGECGHEQSDRTDPSRRRPGAPRDRLRSVGRRGLLHRLGSPGGNPDRAGRRWCPRRGCHGRSPRRARLLDLDTDLCGVPCIRDLAGAARTPMSDNGRSGGGTPPLWS